MDARQKAETCCFTGHRKIPPEQYDIIVRQLEEEIVSSIKLGYRYFGVGGALGFDTLAAQAVVKIKSTYPKIKLILVLPCRSQSSGWTDKNKQIYEDLKKQADKIVYTSERYYKGCMQRRNRHLVDYSSLCICYLTKNGGGTFYTVGYAKSQGLKIRNLGQIV